ncbi:hypothetical protein BACDOR_04253 [Phocaeicola dorei DSM 17855]|uniref:Uncharacterized protein n=1 Tax=Phocaeicola dorei DSM 17855 TaxID=483217 RepID=B6W3V8_9BACT|nr:hypothetical protein BACDOR_04253 [Phocaeicola dorei DSM 17855]
MFQSEEELFVDEHRKRCTSYFIPSFMGAVLIVILQNEISLMEVYLL